MLRNLRGRIVCTHESELNAVVDPGFRHASNTVGFHGLDLQRAMRMDVNV